MSERRIADSGSGIGDRGLGPGVAVRLRIFVIGSLLALAGCASLPVMNPPHIEIDAVSLDRVEGADAYFTIAATVANPRSDDMVIEALRGSLAIEGETIAQAMLVTAPLRVPGKGRASAALAAHAGMDAVLRAVAAAMRRGATLVAPGEKPTLRYTIEGTATLAGGARVPFRRSGELGERKAPG
jgi:hypothetical protein